MIQQNNNNWNTGTLEYPYGRGINISMEVKDIEKIVNKLKQQKYKLFKEIIKKTEGFNLLSFYCNQLACACIFQSLYCTSIFLYQEVFVLYIPE